MSSMTRTGKSTPTAAPARLSPPWRKLLLVVHLIAAVGLVGADAVILALHIAGLRGADPATVYPAGHLVAQAVVVPMAVTALAAGVTLGLLTSWGLVRHWWVATKLALTIALTGVALFLLIPRTGAAAAAAKAGELVPDADRMRLVLFPAAAGTVLVVNVVLGVYKPFGRLSRRRTNLTT
jgi:hypothetical protein